MKVKLAVIIFNMIMVLIPSTVAIYVTVMLAVILARITACLSSQKESSIIPQDVLWKQGPPAPESRGRMGDRHVTTERVAFPRRLCNATAAFLVRSHP